MEKTTLRIKTDKKHFWKKYVSILNPVLNLIPRERDVMACLMMIQSANKNRKDLDKILLSYDSRVAIRQYMDVSENVINNIICDLKKKGLLLKTKKGYLVNPTVFGGADGTKDHIVEYKLMIDGHI